jgi:drug/metabolite transporter (DMT)-like permease
MREIFLGSICAFLITLGQVLWKLALLKTKFSFSSDITIRKVINLIFSPYMIFGIIIYFFATVFWIYLLDKFEYSKIYPTLAIAYLFALIFAYFIFKENIGWNKISGVFLIISGILIITKGG